MKTAEVLLLLAAGIMLSGSRATGNNVVVTNVDLKGPGSGLVKVEFDLSWDHSWRDPVNYDACWVFVKYSVNSGTNWGHATLAESGTNPVGFTAGVGTGVDIVVPPDRKGAFIQRSSPGTGTVANTAMRLVWDFETDGVTASQRARVKVFAIEMVYVPQGSFYVGDGSISSIRGQFESGTNGTPFLITSEGELTLGGGGAGSLGNNNRAGMHAGALEDYNDITSKTLPAAFPKGYAAFYMMKTEVSQRQYCDFLNTLTATQQANMHDSGLNYIQVFRNFIKKTSGNPVFFGCDGNNNAGSSTAADAARLNETNDGEWVACNYMYPPQGAAYSDWAGLRPMTELEYEKACRGLISPVANECAWGNTIVEPLTGSLSGANTASERPDQGNCHLSGCLPSGSFRCGIYADATSSRQEAGAGFCGALDLSGNLWERAVCVGDATCRNFNGTHGDGILSVNGYANEATWPGLVGGQVTGWLVGMRGGGFTSASADLRVSDRYMANLTNTGLQYYYGWRAVRTAP